MHLKSNKEQRLGNYLACFCADADPGPPWKPRDYHRQNLVNITILGYFQKIKRVRDLAGLWYSAT